MKLPSRIVRYDLLFFITLPPLAHAAVKRCSAIVWRYEGVFVAPRPLPDKLGWPQAIRKLRAEGLHGSTHETGTLAE